MSGKDFLEGYHLIEAIEDDLPFVYKIIDDRIHWMDEVGINQWNKTNYWECYPESYYINRMNHGELFVFKHEKSGKIIGTICLFPEDYRWVPDKNALYAHHLATSLGVTGTGRAIIEASKVVAANKGKECLRLDCAIGNDNLNTFYESMGFEYVGPVVDRLYKGNLREFCLNSRDSVQNPF